MEERSGSVELFLSEPSQHRLPGLGRSHQRSTCRIAFDGRVALYARSILQPATGPAVPAQKYDRTSANGGHFRRKKTEYFRVKYGASPDSINSYRPRRTPLETEMS